MDTIIGIIVIILKTCEEDCASLYVLAKEVIAMASPDINSDAAMQIIILIMIVIMLKILIFHLIL